MECKYCGSTNISRILVEDVEGWECQDCGRAFEDKPTLDPTLGVRAGITLRCPQCRNMAARVIEEPRERTDVSVGRSVWLTAVSMSLTSCTSSNRSVSRQTSPDQ